MSECDRLIAVFKKTYNTEPDVIARAPGRVEIIGGHTDYNDGFVLPMAIDKEVLVLARRRTDSTVRLTSEMFAETVTFDVASPIVKGEPAWANYCKGVAHLLVAAGKKLIGLDMLVASTVPSGGGLSSSAALEVAYANAFLGSTGQTMDPVDVALLAQKAEHTFAGTPCGIMDQFISVLGHKDHALLIDCRSYKYEQVHMPTGSAGILIADSKVKHNLGSSEYPVRRSQCHAAAEIIARSEPTVKALRDVDFAMLDRYASKLDPIMLQRARHIVGENQRVMQAAEGFRTGNLAAAGDAMNRSHNSLRDDYQVSCAELDFLVDAVRPMTGVYGARMSGGGFGGCIVALVDPKHGEKIQADLKQIYKTQKGIDTVTFITSATEGAQLLKSPTKN